MKKQNNYLHTKEKHFKTKDIVEVKKRRYKKSKKKRA